MMENECKVCNSKNIHKFLSLGPSPLANNYIKKEKLEEKEEVFPLDLYFCKDCLFVQLGQIIDPKILFKDYLYVSSTSETLKKQFQDLAEDIKSRTKDDSFIVEIASNDGTLLKNFKEYKILGVEPASNIAKIAIDNGIKTLNKFFNIETANDIVKKNGKADVVIGTNIFAHIPDLNEFIEAIKILLDKNGFAIFESPYLFDLMEKLEFDTIYHEHIYYLSLKPLIKLFKKHDLEIFDVKRTNMHGGSIRFFVGNNNFEIKDRVKELISLEEKMGFDKVEVYEDFSNKVLNFKEKLYNLLIELKKSGHSIAGYGAPAKATTLLNYLGIGKEIIDFIADKSPLKQDLFMPGNKIPIFSTDKILKENPDYLIILAWNFADEIMKQNEEYKKNGGKFIIPIPDPKII